jgi:hypothetical protein
VGERPKQPFQLSFNTSLKIDFQGSRVTSDGGLILVRELDERLGFGELIQQHLTDSRRGKNTQFPLADLLRQSVYSRLAGYEDLNDAERLSQDPTFRLMQTPGDSNCPPPQSVETRSETNPTDSCIQWPPNICCGGLPESKNGNSPPLARRTFSAFTGC